MILKKNQKCIICGKSVHFLKNGINQYRLFCSKACLNTPEGLKIKFEKSNKTNLEKYGVSSPQHSEIIKKKTAETNLKKYGNKMYLLSELGLKRVYLERIHNNSQYISKIEYNFLNYLEQNYPNDFEYQYKSELYPFNCDFYIKSLNLYIEIQGDWTHGGHPFDKNNLEDIDRLNLWKSKNTLYYNYAVYNWSNRDVNKRNIAKLNNLNYLEIFSIKLDKCIELLNNYIKTLP